jgi:Na+-driven multidrug efflux pump
MGIQSAACAIIGEQIGANRAIVAKEYMKIMTGITLMMTIAISVTVYIRRESIIDLFTADPEVATIANRNCYLITIIFIPDMVQGAIQGVIRALDIQKTASCIALASFYLVSIPVAFVLVFVWGLGLSGLLIGYLVGVTFLTFSYIRLVTTTSWVDVANSA